MKKLMNTFMLFCSLFAFSGCTDEAQLLPAAKGEQGWYVNPYLDDLWVKVRANEAGLDIWDICQFILEASDLGWDQKYLKVALTNLTDAQIRTEGHHNYGQIPRYIGGDTETTSFDKNNAEFLMELLSLERMLYYDRLDAANKTLLDDLIDYSVYAILDDPNIAITYTNIYVMRTWNLIALGETLPDDRTWGRSMNVRPEELAEEGYRLFRDWMAEIKKNGIHEHNSPTYTGVQVECLGYLAKYTKNESIRHEANVALEYLSAMAFANYFTPAMMLGGVQSRCYYKGSSNGKIDNIMGGLIKGWGTYFFNRLAMWTPTDQARRINATYPRLVCYKWGWDPDMNAVGYYTEKYNISSVGRTYTGNANEKTMTIFLSSPRQKTLVNIVHYFDGRQDPYGKNYINGLARHLQKYALGRSQRNNEFVAMVSGDGSERGDTKKLQSHIILPSNYIDEVWLGNEKIDKWLSIGNKALPAGDNYTFFLRFDDVVVSIRYLYAVDVNGKQATPRLYIDTDGSQVFTSGNAMRITTDLSTGTPAKWTRGTVAMWWRVDDGITTDEQFAALREKVINAAGTVTDDGSRISVQVTTPDGDLGFSGNLVRKVFPQAVQANPTSPDNKEYWGFEQTATVGGIEAENVLFTVNGEDIAGPIFQKSNL